jgi:hypothetical protein
MSNTFLPGMTECDEKIVQKIVPYKSLNLEPISKRKIIRKLPQVSANTLLPKEQK